MKIRLVEITERNRIYYAVQKKWFNLFWTGAFITPSTFVDYYSAIKKYTSIDLEKS